jgi:hypothetical protein
MKPTFSSRTSHRSRTRLAAIAAVAIASTPLARTAWADPSALDVAQARELFNEGMRLHEKGDDAGALEKLKGANALAHTPITGLELGRTYAALGKLVEAREALLEVGRMPQRAEETARSRTARTQASELAEKLRARIPSLTVRITGVAASDVAVTIDDSAVPTDALAAPRLLNPGAHEVSARSTSGGKAQSSVELKEGEERLLELKLVFEATAQSATPPHATTPAPEAPPVTEPPRDLSPEPTGSRGSSVPGWILLGAGAAVGIGGAVLMGVEAGSAKDATTSHDKSAYDGASTGWTVGLVGVIVGGAAVAGGGIWLALHGHGSSSTTGSATPLGISVGPGSVRLAGSF